MYDHDKPWTAFIEPFLKRMGTLLGFRADGPYPACVEISREWCRIDVAYFSVFSPITGTLDNWDWEVAIEHENGGHLEWFQEFVKLVHVCCGLKVIITYHDYTARGLSIEDKLQLAKKLYDARRYRVLPDNWLLIFGSWWRPRTAAEDYVAYSFNGAEFGELPRQKVLWEAGEQLIVAEPCRLPSP
jgi:hypothetical protein